MKEEAVLAGVGCWLYALLLPPQLNVGHNMIRNGLRLPLSVSHQSPSPAALSLSRSRGLVRDSASSLATTVRTRVCPRWSLSAVGEALVSVDDLTAVARLRDFWANFVCLLPCSCSSCRSMQNVGACKSAICSGEFGLPKVEFEQR